MFLDLFHKNFFFFHIPGLLRALVNFLLASIGLSYIRRQVKMSTASLNCKLFVSWIF